MLFSATVAATLSPKEAVLFNSSPKEGNGAMRWLLTLLLVALASCSAPEFSGNGVTPCGNDLPEGRCPVNQTCCSGRCYDSVHRPPACIADAAPDVSGDTVIVADTSPDAGDAPAPDAANDADAATADVQDADAADVGDAADAQADADAAPDVTDVPDASDVTDADTAPDVVEMDVPMDVPADVLPDLPIDLPRDMGLETAPDVMPDVPADRPVDTGCMPSQLLCSMACIDPQTDPAHCGRCGSSCPSGTTCTAGTCRCPTGQTLCGSTCVDVLTNATHCGRCDNACSGTMACTAGTCLALMGRLTLRARRASIFYSDYDSTTTLDSLREGSQSAASRYFDTGETWVAAYRYMGTTRAQLARTAVRFDRIVIPLGTTVRAITLQLTPVAPADNPPQRLVVVPFRPPSTSWTNSYWSPLSLWGITPVTGAEDIPTLWSAEVAGSSLMDGVSVMIPLTGSALTELPGASTPTIGLMEVHDAYGRALDPLPMDGTRFARIQFSSTLTNIVLLVDYGP